MLGAIFAPLSVLLIVMLLVDGFESMVLPRRVTHSYRLTRFYFRICWKLCRVVANRLPPRQRLGLLGVFGPLALLGLFVVWVVGFVTAFALLHWSLGTVLTAPHTADDFGTYFYFSGVTFLTLGYGDVVPLGWGGRLLAVVEAGLGFGFMAVIIGYLPTLFQAFSTRETTISLLDARAGSPPTAVQGLLRAVRANGLSGMDGFFAEWERWAAQLLESHLSYPVLGFYRSQHDNQSWLAALTFILDSSAIVLAGLKGVNIYQTQLTFAMARHAAVDLVLVFKTDARPPEQERLTASQVAVVREQLLQAGLDLQDAVIFENKLTKLRAAYEPFVHALSHYFLLPLPAIVAAAAVVDNWQTSAWMRRLGCLEELSDGHFD